MGDIINTFLSGDETELTLLYWGLFPFVLAAAGVAWLWKKITGQD